MFLDFDVVAIKAQAEQEFNAKLKEVLKAKVSELFTGSTSRNPRWQEPNQPIYIRQSSPVTTLLEESVLNLMNSGKYETIIAEEVERQITFQVSAMIKDAVRHVVRKNHFNSTVQAIQEEIKKAAE